MTIPTSKYPFLPPKHMEVSIEEIGQICETYGLDELWQTISNDPPSEPFMSDGCSAWPDNWFNNDLYEGCFLHDLHYWAGYPGDEVGRLVADAFLLVWVAQNATVELAEKMYFGVRVGGVDWLPTPWRYGFGRI